MAIGATQSIGSSDFSPVSAQPSSAPSSSAPSESASPDSPASPLDPPTIDSSSLSGEAQDPESGGPSHGLLNGLAQAFGLAEPEEKKEESPLQERQEISNAVATEGAMQGAEKIAEEAQEVAQTGSKAGKQAFNSHANEQSLANNDAAAQQHQATGNAAAAEESHYRTQAQGAQQQYARTGNPADKARASELEEKANQAMQRKTSANGERYSALHAKNAASIENAAMKAQQAARQETLQTAQTNAARPGATAAQKSHAENLAREAKLESGAEHAVCGALKAEGGTLRGAANLGEKVALKEAGMVGGKLLGKLIPFANAGIAAYSAMEDSKKFQEAKAPDEKFWRGAKVAADVVGGLPVPGAGLVSIGADAIEYGTTFLPHKK